MTAVIYTHPPDYVMASLSARVLVAQGVRVVFAVDASHPLPACDFARSVHTTFDRKGNLNGKPFIIGNLELMAAVGEGDYTLKVDSDTLVLDVARLLAGRTQVAVGVWVPSMGGMQGCCYALRNDALPAMIEGARKLNPKATLIEDRVTGQLASAVGKVHLPVHGNKGDLYTTWRPDRADLTPDWCRANRAVVVFPPKSGVTREDAAQAMSRFL